LVGKLIVDGKVRKPDVAGEMARWAFALV